MLQETFSLQSVFDAKHFKYRCRDVAVPVQRAQVDVFFQRFARRKQENIFSAVVGAGRERIAAVVGRYHQNVVGFHIIHKRREPRVEFGDGFCISVHVVSVAVFHIEVHKVHKAKPVEVLCLQFFRNAHAVGVIVDMISFLYALSVENIVNLSDADRVQPFSFDKVKHVSPGGVKEKSWRFSVRTKSG